MQKTPQRLPFIDLAAQQRRIRKEIEAAISRVLDHGQYVMGPEVFALESELAEYTGAKEVVSCSSGTDALWLPLLAWEVGPGDAVFLPSFTFTATAEAVALVGATPVFVDVREDSCNIDAMSLEAAIESIRRAGTLRPSGIIAVDLFGQPADYDALRAVADRWDLWLLADAAQSFGAALGERRVGTLAHATATSFFPSKPLGCYGDGGAVFTDDREFAERLRSIRIHGRGAGGKYDNVRIGTNARLDTLQAAILLAKMTVFDEEAAVRAKVAKRYTAGLFDVVRVPEPPADRRCAWAHYTIQTEGRDRLRQELDLRGVPSNVYYPRPLHRQSVFAQCPRAPGGLEASERLCGRVLSLVMHPYLARETQDEIIGHVRAAMEGAGAQA